MAGGLKYVHMGIFFKYLISLLINNPSHGSLLTQQPRFALDWAGLYGGDEYAMKAASHELKGLASVYDVGANVNGTRLCVPFMVLIDELGFRYVTYSCMHASSTFLTLVIA